MLVDDEPTRAAWVQQCLEKSGVTVCGVVDEPLRLLKVIEEEAPDVIIIDMASPGRDLLESLTVIAEHQPVPVVMFSEEENPDYIRRAVAAGVSTYLVGSIDPAKVQPIIDVALAQFRHFQSLQQALRDSRSELSGKRVIDAAKHALMDRYRLSEDEAYGHLRREAMNRGMRINELAARILEQV